MLTIKGFCTRRLQADNNPHKVATFGELSPLARTFARDIGIYSKTDTPEFEFNVFSHKRDGVSVGLVNTEFTDSVIEITKWIYDKSLTIGSDASRQDYLVDMGNMFYGRFQNLTVGTIKYSQGRTMPEWFSFSKNDGTDNTVKIWLSSDAFERDYDEYEIIVVPPLINVDTFFQPPNEIRSALNAVNIMDQMDLIQDAKQGSPETQLKAEVINYINPNDTNIIIPSTWYVLIYGPAGNNTESIKSAITDFILSKSTQPESAWKLIFPYLFKVTRMYILPRWDKLAIPNRTTNVGIYSPVATVSESLTYAKTSLFHMSTSFIDLNLQVTHHKYRAVSLLCCGGEDNAQDKFKLTDYFPDYIAESSNSQDFNRMAENTKLWTVLMEQLLILAENYNEDMSLPINVRRLTISNVKYVGKRFNNVEFLVAVREVS